MANSFADLKRSGNKDLERLSQEINKLSDKPEGKKSYEDTRFWKPTVDKVGNGSATIRFLPAPASEDVPWVQIFSHSFQGPGGWYIENSLTTINKKDPVSEHNTVLWNSGVEANKEVARKQKRKLQYIANIYVVRDPGNPDNEGKVFLFKFGKKIFDKINEAMNPEFEDESPVNPFHLWEGANFKLKIRQVEGYRNYDKSEFESPAPISDDDATLEKIWKQEHSLQDFLDPSKFKSYDELKAKLSRVLGLDGSAAGARANATKKAEDSAPWDDEAPAPKAKAAPAPKMAESFAEDDDDTMAFFKNLADE